MPKINLNFKKGIFNDVYFPLLLDYSKRYEVYYGGAGSGKSVFIAQKLLIKAINKKRRILIIRKVGTTLKDSVFPLVIDMLKKWKIYEYCKINLSTYTITLPNESVLLFRGLDDSEKIKSITDITDIWCEEATELNLDEFTQLDLRLRALVEDSQIWCSFNPVSKENWVFKKWFDKDAIYDKENTMILKTTYKDNKFLPQDYIDNLLEMAKNNPVYYRIYALGEFATLGKLVYTNWKVENFDYRKILKENSNAIAIFNLDFGFTNDPTAFGAEILDEVNKKIWVFDEFQKKGLLNDEIAKKIIDMGYGKEVIVCDSAEPKSIEELKRNGLYRAVSSIKGKDSIINGIQLLQQYEIIVSPKCICIQEELKNYTWKKDKDGNYINTPIDKVNHGLDSMRYGVTYAIQNKKAGFSIIYR